MNIGYNKREMEESLVKEIPFHSLIVGPTKSGKTRYLTDLLSGHFEGVFDIIILICPTFPFNDTWQNFSGINKKGFYIMCPNSRKKDDIEECLKICNDLFHGNKKYKVLVILDDCAVSVDVKKQSSELVDLVMSGRHHGISVWVLTQQLTSITRPFRENVTFIVSFFNSNKKSEDVLFEEFGSRIDKNSKETILKILDENEFSRICFFKKKFEVHIPNIDI